MSCMIKAWVLDVDDLPSSACKLPVPRRLVVAHSIYGSISFVVANICRCFMRSTPPYRPIISKPPRGGGGEGKEGGQVRPPDLLIKRSHPPAHTSRHPHPTQQGFSTLERRSRKCIFHLTCSYRRNRGGERGITLLPPPPPREATFPPPTIPRSRAPPSDLPLKREETDWGTSEENKGGGGKGPT